MKNSARSVTKAIANGYASMGQIRRLPPLIDDDAPLPLHLGWIRGKAQIVDDQVVLEKAGRSLYRPEAEEQSVLLEFANLDSKDPYQITHFVGCFGLLSEEGLLVSEEPLQEWINGHTTVSGLLNLYYWIDRARKDTEGTPEAFHHFALFAEAIHRLAKKQLHHQKNLDVAGRNDLSHAAATQRFIDLYEKGAFGRIDEIAFDGEQKAQLLRLAMNWLADLLNDALREGVYYGISCAPLSLPKNKALLVRHAMSMNFQAVDLYHYLFLQLSFLSIDSKHIGQCSCGRYFRVTRLDKVHCSIECGGSKRSTKSRNKRATKTT